MKYLFGVSVAKKNPQEKKLKIFENIKILYKQITFLDDQIGHCEGKRVSTVDVITAIDLIAIDGKT